MPKVSIIVPVYNVEKYMRNTIDALCNQTLADIEIILIDDGSTDSSGAICDEFAQKDSRVVVIHSQNEGVCSARNKGLAVASGDYIGFCDSDDMPDLDMYETLYNMITENKTDMSMLQAYVVYDDGSYYTLAKGKGFFVYENRSEFLKEFLKRRFGTAVYKMMFKSELAKSIEFEQGRKINEDKWYAFSALCKADKVCYLDEYKYKYFRREGSSSCSAFSPKYFDIIYFAQKIHDIICKDYPELADYSKAELASAHIQVLKLICLENAVKDYKAEYDKSVAFLRGLNRKYCKAYLKKSDYIKWSALKLNNLCFKVAIKLFSKN